MLWPIADSMQRNLVEPSGWSQSSAAEAAASQGKLELLLVVRYGYCIALVLSTL